MPALAANSAISAMKPLEKRLACCAKRSLRLANQLSSAPLAASATVIPNPNTAAIDTTVAMPLNSLPRLAKNTACASASKDIAKATPTSAGCNCRPVRRNSAAATGPTGFGTLLSALSAWLKLEAAMTSRKQVEMATPTPSSQCGNAALWPYSSIEATRMTAL